MHVSAVINQQLTVKKYTFQYINFMCLLCQPVRLPDCADEKSDREEKDQQEQVRVRYF